MSYASERYWAKIRKVVRNLKWLERKEMPSRCGVYILMDNDTPQYLGKSVRVDARLVTHRTAKRIPFAAVLFAEVAPELLNDVERELLLQYNPPRNTIFPAKDRPPITNRELGRLFQPDENNS